MSVEAPFTPDRMKQTESRNSLNNNLNRIDSEFFGYKLEVSSLLNPENKLLLKLTESDIANLSHAIIKIKEYKNSIQVIQNLISSLPDIHQNAYNTKIREINRKLNILTENRNKIIDYMQILNEFVKQRNDEYNAAKEVEATLLKPFSPPLRQTQRKRVLSTSSSTSSNTRTTSTTRTTRTTKQKIGGEITPEQKPLFIKQQQKLLGMKIELETVLEVTKGIMEKNAINTEKFKLTEDETVKIYNLLFPKIGETLEKYKPYQERVKKTQDAYESSVRENKSEIEKERLKAELSSEKFKKQTFYLDYSGYLSNYYRALSYIEEVEELIKKVDSIIHNMGEERHIIKENEFDNYEIKYIYCVNKFNHIIDKIKNNKSYEFPKPGVFTI